MQLTPFNLCILLMAAFVGLVFLSGCQLFVKRYGLPLFVVAICLTALFGLMAYLVTVPISYSNTIVNSFSSTVVPTEHTDHIMFEMEPSPTPR